MAVISADNTQRLGSKFAQQTKQLITLQPTKAKQSHSIIALPFIFTTILIVLMEKFQLLFKSLLNR